MKKFYVLLILQSLLNVANAGGGSSRTELAFKCEGYLSAGPRKEESTKITIFQNMDYFPGSSGSVRINGISYFSSVYKALKLESTEDNNNHSERTFVFKSVSDFSLSLLKTFTLFITLGTDDTIKRSFFNVNERGNLGVVVSSSGSLDCVGSFK